MSKLTKAKLEAQKRGERATIDLDAEVRAEYTHGRPGAVPDTDYKAVLQLSSAIEYSRDADYSMVRWATQCEAAAYFNQHGLSGTLARIDELTKFLTARETEAT